MLVVDPIASKVVKHIFELAAGGNNPPKIARILTEEKTLISYRIYLRSMYLKDHNNLLIVFFSLYF